MIRLFLIKFSPEITSFRYNDENIVCAEFYRYGRSVSSGEHCFLSLCHRALGRASGPGRPSCSGLLEPIIDIVDCEGDLPDCGRISDGSRHRFFLDHKAMKLQSSLVQRIPDSADGRTPRPKIGR
jgi:hypothetical protein